MNWIWEFWFVQFSILLIWQFLLLKDAFLLGSPYRTVSVILNMIPFGFVISFILYIIGKTIENEEKEYK